MQNLKSLQYSVILRQLTVVENAGQDRLSRQVSMPAEFGESYGNYAENFFSFGRSFVLLKILIFMLKWCWRIPKITLHMLYYLIMSCEFSLENSHWYLLFCVLRTCLPCFTLTLWTCTSALCHKVHLYLLFRTLFWTYPFIPTYRV